MADKRREEVDDGRYWGFTVGGIQVEKNGRTIATLGPVATYKNMTAEKAFQFETLVADDPEIGKILAECNEKMKAYLKGLGFKLLSEKEAS